MLRDGGPRGPDRRSSGSDKQVPLRVVDAADPLVSAFFYLPLMAPAFPRTLSSLAQCRRRVSSPPFPLYSPGFTAHVSSVSTSAPSISPAFSLPPLELSLAAIVPLCRRLDSTRAPTKRVTRTAEHPSCHPSHSPAPRSSAPLQFHRNSAVGFFPGELSLPQFVAAVVFPATLTPLSSS